MSYYNSGAAYSTVQLDGSTDLSDTLLIIPTKNEEEAIGELVSESRAIGFSNILVIDGFSSDFTSQIAKKAGARVIFQEFGNGKGCGVRTGMKEFLQGNYEYLSMIDGDGSNTPSSLKNMISTARMQKADVVLGSRTRGYRDKKAMNLLSLASNLIVSFLLGIKFERIFTDVQTGYWLFTRDAVERIYPQIESRGFEIELELIVTVLRMGMCVIEIPASFRRRKGHTKFSFELRMRNLYFALKFLVS
ncbi:MAG TPA: glycosyltransferase family 2 protein [Candidatus Bathyarchaeia archaeon]|nr:glycosyltransferase family 2 protein [Candidatus Bathyarchaeia archaeon]